MALTTTVTQSPPQLLPQAVPGYNAAQNFYQGVLNNTPSFTGDRTAGPSGIQNNLFANAQNLLGLTGTDVNNAATSQLTSTMRGNYLGGPEMQSAIQSAIAPIMQQYTSDVLPGLRDRSAGSGGLTSARRGIGEQLSLQTLGNSLATGVVAPIYNAERQNMINAVNALTGQQQADTSAVNALNTIGGVQQGLNQAELDANQKAFWEPWNMRGQAAQALLGNAPATAGGATTTQTDSGSTLGDINASMSTLQNLLATLGIGADLWKQFFPSS